MTPGSQLLDFAHFAAQASEQVECSRWFTFHELEKDCRWIELGADGSIGVGFNQQLQRWQVRADSKAVILELTGQIGPQYKLNLGFDNIWRGKSLVQPGSFVQLIPRNIASNLRPAGFPHFTNVPFDLVERLRDRLGLCHFIETGTFQGVTSKLMATRFPNVITIEAQPNIFAQTSASLAAYPNIKCLLGDSAELLPTVLREIDSQSIIWLDAHWCGPGTGKCRTECPLMRELELIYGQRSDHIVLIDDARLFLGSPPPPHDAADWPTFPQLCELLCRQQTMPLIQLLGDVIFLGPQQVSEEVFGYCRRQAHTPPDHDPGLWWA